VKRFGPGLLIMAAFIGPGTVTTASAAGANYGFALLWALLFSVVATIVLQEMAARLGLVTGKGLADALRTTFNNKVFANLSIVLVVLAIGFGNAAYESGNIAGSSLGLAAITPVERWVWCVLVAGIAFALLASGQYKVVERGLIVMVAVMSTVFLATMLMVQPDIGAVLSGLFKPSLPTGATLTVIALIGTTVVPYNLFLHSSLVQEKWSDSVSVDEALAESRKDSAVAISFGGLITLAIVITAASTFFGKDIEFSAQTMAHQLEPVLGASAKYFFAIGLFAAGLTSAVTSPLAAAYAVSGAMGWPTNMSETRFKAIWALVLVVGAIIAAVGTKPITAILVAQATNGFLLPMVAVFLLVVMNRSDLLGTYRNKLWGNILGAAVVAVVSGLGLTKLWQAVS
jgi:NRAMP (natural resistance-associated macrophage protein)-like metal ion transporter